MTSTLSLPSSKTLRLLGLLALLCTVLGIITASSTASAYELNLETAVPTAAVIKLNDPLVTGGNINVQRISPDNSTVVFTADAEIDGVNELYSVPIGGGTVTKLNPDLSGSRDVNTFQITPDSSTVVFIADVDTVGEDELYSVPIDGGTATKLNNPVTSGGRIADFTLSPDGNTVVYIGDPDTFDITELYSVPVGGGPVTKLSPNNLTTTREVLFTRRISADSSTVVYLGDQNTNNVNELFSVPIGGGTVTRLNDPLPSGGGVGLFGFGLSPDGSTVVYSADQETNNVHELFSVPIGGGTVTKLNSTLPSGSFFIAEFKFTPDSSTVVYRGAQDTVGIDELFAVPIGGGTPIKVSEPGANLFNYEISADGSTVVYQTSTGGQGVDELFSAPIGGGTVTQLNGPLAVGETVDFFELSKDSSTVIYTTEPFDTFDALSTGLFSVPINGGTITQLSGPFAENSGVGGVDISPDSSMVLFEADQETAGVTELFIVPIGGGPTTKLNDPLVSGGDVNNFRFSPDSSIVIYEADQDTDEVDELYSVSLEIALNLAPVAADDAYSTNPDTPLTVAAPGVLANDTDANDDAVTAVLISNVSNGTLTLNADGSFTYTPNAGFTGNDSFTYQTNDGIEDSNVATVTITVQLHTLYLPLIVK
ncbi:MAG: cadherin-like domain-containing protein [Ardenticatenaceae bacterium]|nr:cadherin-like domain-containing protein [Ardenticatenaceae bacterium]